MAVNMHLNMRHMTVITVVMMCDDEDFEDDDDDDNKDDVDDDEDDDDDEDEDDEDVGGDDDGDEDNGDDGGGDCDDSGQRTEEGYQVPETRHWYEGGSGLPSAGIQALVWYVVTSLLKPGAGSQARVGVPEPSAGSQALGLPWSLSSPGIQGHVTTGRSPGLQNKHGRTPRPLQSHAV